MIWITDEMLVDGNKKPTKKMTKVEVAKTDETLPRWEQRGMYYIYTCKEKHQTQMQEKPSGHTKCKVCKMFQYAKDNGGFYLGGIAFMCGSGKKHRFTVEPSRHHKMTKWCEQCVKGQVYYPTTGRVQKYSGKRS